jgi:pyrroloquinoline quinone biosynthesis protein E
MAARKHELSTEAWTNIFQQSSAMGMLHAHFTGGEPLLRADIVDLVAAARAHGLYVNLITSGVGLSEEKLSAMVNAGLDHIQLSFQDSQVGGATEISGVQVQAKKLEAARLIKKTNLAFTVNLVVHRKNLDRLEQLIDFAAALGPQRIEIANVQYYGWAVQNRNALLPTRAQVEKSIETLRNARARLASQNITIDFVTPDSYGKYPKPCMGGWGRRMMLVDPTGKAMPCHAAAVIPIIKFDNVREHPLRWIWEESSAFQMFRGTGWMQDPCKTCPKQEQDFGGCRCQAFLLTGDATAADPVCSLSADRPKVEEILQIANAQNKNAVKDIPPPHLPPEPLIYRLNP